MRRHCSRTLCNRGLWLDESRKHARCWRCVLQGILLVDVSGQTDWQSRPIRLSLPEAARDLLTQRLEQVLQRRSRIGLDEDFRRHAGQESESLEPCDFGLRQRHAYDIIDLSRPGRTRLVAREVGGHVKSPCR